MVESKYVLEMIKVTELLFQKFNFFCTSDTKFETKMSKTTHYIYIQFIFSTLSDKNDI